MDRTPEKELMTERLAAIATLEPKVVYTDITQDPSSESGVSNMPIIASTLIFKDDEDRHYRATFSPGAKGGEIRLLVCHVFMHKDSLVGSPQLWPKDLLGTCGQSLIY